MADLIDTTEMYLRTILELEEEGLIPIRARISERLGHSGPTVSQTVARMERDGLVAIADDRLLVLTDLGRRDAISVMRKHRLAERLLSDVIGLEWEFVHEEACRWEHVMSEKVERRIIALLGDPHESPYGNPIPGLEELGSLPSRAFSDGVISLADAVAEGRGRAEGMLKRLGEPIQSDAVLLRAMRDAGLVPGATIVASLEGKNVTLSPVDDGGVVVTSRDALLHLFIVS
ncbi:MAG: dihydrofolate reductase [Actinobacteria bacterium]|jgi:DtxR family Mn-dependent transcriptional regulator|uniref:Unannotated protein n=1 Tax=freshwater metagenome TaxID=449393 RepID=A0A6J7FYG0_9ZZZZ|nr:dihydrofolate reductase [Actinomycetota bacterium]